MTDDELDGLAHLVKHLEWEEIRAQSPFGEYATGRIGGEWRVYLNLSTGRVNGHMVVAEGEEETFEAAGEAAKAAAQADYTRRILSALNLDALRSPPADVGAVARATPDELLDEIGKRLQATDPDVAPWALHWVDRIAEAIAQAPDDPRSIGAALRALAETTKGDE